MWPIISGVTCLVVSPAERERGGSTKVADAMYDLFFVTIVFLGGNFIMFAIVVESLMIKKEIIH